MKALLLNRFVLVPGAIALLIALWNFYVATHNHGVIVGRVLDASGQPVPDATVALWTYNFTTYEEREHVTTNANGAFRFDNNPSHRIQLSAEKTGVGRSRRIPVYLYFRSQDIELAAPLRLGGAS